MSYLAVIFCYVLKKINGNRTINGAFHILKGKKSAQTLQDCHLFNLTNVFGVYKSIKKDEVDEALNYLKQNQLVNEEAYKHFLLTNKGDIFLEREISKNPIPIHLKGFIYKDKSEHFFKRLHLTIQSLSCLKSKNKQFIPIVNDRQVQIWVKKFLANSDCDLDTLLNLFYNELCSILNQFSKIEATIFVLKLTSSHRVGLTNEQIAKKLQLDDYYSDILFQGVLHGMLENVLNNPHSYCILHKFIENMDTTTLLTDSAQKTLTMLKKGLNIVEIGKARQLKVSTVEDHIVEIATNKDDFDITLFVSEEEQQKILTVIADLNTKKLKQIKEKLNDEVSYFAIRLTVAKKGAKRWN